METSSTSEWKNIVSIDCCDHGILGLKANGKVAVTNGLTKGSAKSSQVVAARLCGDNVVAVSTNGDLVGTEFTDLTEDELSQFNNIRAFLNEKDYTDFVNEQMLKINNS